MQEEHAAAHAALLRAVALAEERGMLFESALAHWELRRYAPAGRKHLERACEIFAFNGSRRAEERCRRALDERTAWGVNSVWI